jgi:hypothetical protein
MEAELTQKLFNTNLKEEILNYDFINTNLERNRELLEEKIAKFAQFMTFSGKKKKFNNEEEKKRCREILVSISTLKIWEKDEDIESDCLLVSNLIGSFLEYMKIISKSDDLEKKCLQFYFKLILNYLKNISENIKLLPENLLTSFEYILLLLTTNVMSILPLVDMEEDISTFITTLLEIQKEKRFDRNNACFSHLTIIFKRQLEDIPIVPAKILNDFLLVLTKKNTKEVDPTYQLIYFILDSMENALNPPVKTIILKIMSSKPSKSPEKKSSDTNHLGILEIQNLEFLNLLINLANINHEYILNFLISIPDNHIDLLKKEIRGVRYLDLMCSLLKCKNSLTIYNNFHNIFENFMNMINLGNKLIKEADRFKIFCSIVKFIYSSKKPNFEFTNVKKSLIKKIEIFFDMFSTNLTMISRILNFLQTKYLGKGLKISSQIIKLTQIFLNNISEELIINFNFLLLNKKILLPSSLFDLNTFKGRKRLKKFSFLFTNLLNKYSNKQIFMEKFKENFDFKLSHSEEDNNKSKITILLFYLAIENDAINKFHAFLIKNLEESKKKENFERLNFFQAFVNSGFNFLGNFIHKLINIPNIWQMENFNQIIQAFLCYYFYFFKIYYEYTPDSQKETIEEEMLFFKRLMTRILFIVANNTEGDINKNFKYVIDYIIIISKLICLNSNDDLIIFEIKEMFLKSLSNFCFEKFQASIKALAKQCCELNIEKMSSEVKFLPEDFNHFLIESDIFNHKLSALKFINNFLENSLKYAKMELKRYFFSEKYLNYILKDLSPAIREIFQIKYASISVETVSNTEEIHQLKRELITLIKINQQIMKYEFFYHLLEITEGDSIQEISQTYSKKNIKLMFRRIYELSNILRDLEKEGQEITILTEDSENEENTLQHKKYKILKLKTLLNKIEICQLINLILKHGEYDISISQNYQVKFANLSISRELFIRQHLLNKLEKFLLPNNLSKFPKSSLPSSLLHFFPAVLLYFNDPNKMLKKQAINLWVKFLKYISNKLEEKLEVNRKTSSEGKSYNIKYLYKYLPEMYINYLVMYWVFNSNLNLVFQSKGMITIFENILNNMMKPMSKHIQYDSDFIARNMNKLKEKKFTEHIKIIKKISEFTYLREYITCRDSFALEKKDYEHVKNEICELIMKKMNGEFATNIKRIEFKPILLTIFQVETEENKVLEKNDTINNTNDKSLNIFDKRDDYNINNNLPFLDKSIKNYADRILESDKRSINRSNVARGSYEPSEKFVDTSIKSNRAVHKLNLEVRYNINHLEHFKEIKCDFR